MRIFTTIIIGLICFSFSLESLACNCANPKTFCETITFGNDGKINPKYLIVRAIKDRDTPDGMQLSIIDILHGIETNSTIEVVRGQGPDCRMNTDDFEIGQEMILALWPGGLLDPLYSVSICGITVLDIKPGNLVEGKIAPGTDILPYDKLKSLANCGELDPDEFNFEVTLFPNPTSNKSFLVFEGSGTFDANIIIFDTSGRKVTQFTLEYNEQRNLRELEIDRLPAGMYFVQVRIGIQQKTFKVVRI